MIIRACPCKLEIVNSHVQISLVSVQLDQNLHNASEGSKACVSTLPKCRSKSDCANAQTGQILYCSKRPGYTLLHILGTQAIHKIYDHIFYE